MLGSLVISNERAECRKGHREGGWSFSAAHINSQVEMRVPYFDPSKGYRYENVLQKIVITSGQGVDDHQVHMEKVQLKEKAWS